MVQLTDDGLIKGVIFSAQYLVISHGEHTLAKYLLKESGFSRKKLLSEQAKTGYYDQEMNKIIKDATRRV